MTESKEEQTRYEEFLAYARSNIESYRKELKGDGTFDYLQQVDQLEKLSNKINLSMLVYLFGERLGTHLAEKFVIECNRNLLSFLSRLHYEYRVFILHELKNNELIFMQG